MSDRPDESVATVRRLDQDPTGVLAAARARLADGRTTVGERADALLTLGRAAYYANRMDEAVVLLREALASMDDTDRRADTLLMLAPAVSKEGRPGEALELLDDPALTTGPRVEGQADKQRGIILTEAGRLPEALVATERALQRLRQADDQHHIAQALVNLGVITSFMGRLEEAARWYEEAHDLTIETGQEMIAAGIEGNLGHLASRRGDFVAALAWYERARHRFEQLGDVGLLVANLELDYARTLLELGMAADAVEAAERGVRSAAAGANQMLELQSRLVLAEALIDAGERRHARREIDLARKIVERTGHTAGALRASYLAAELAEERPVTGAERGAEQEIEWFVRAGWGREAYAWMLRRASRWWLDRPAAVHDLVAEADDLTADLDVDPVARALGAMLLAATGDDPTGLDEAFERALDALGAFREMIPSSEAWPMLTRLARPIAEVAIETALRRGDSPEELLAKFERCRAIQSRPPVLDSPRAPEVARLRDARVALAESKLNGGDVAAATALVRGLEERMTDHRSRSRLVDGSPGGRPTSGTADRLDRVALPPDTAYVAHIVSRGRIVAVARVGDRVAYAELASVERIGPLLRSQRSALRRIGDGRRHRSDTDLARLRRANEALDEALLRPLDLGDAARVVFTPAAQVRNVAWAALPSFDGRRLTIASSLAAWASRDDPVRVRRLAFLGGAELEHAGAELAAIGRAWERPDAVVASASCEQAITALARADLLHVAAHGAFRSDNPFFSSLRFADGGVTVQEICGLDRVPGIVVLASCDGATSSGQNGIDDDAIVGTALQLSRAGARAVIAPTVAVGDAAAGELSVRLHQELAAGRSIDDAMAAARRALCESGDPVRLVTAWSFQVLGDRSTREPIVLGLRP